MSERVGTENKRVVDDIRTRPIKDGEGREGTGGSWALTIRQEEPLDGEALLLALARPWPENEYAGRQGQPGFGQMGRAENGDDERICRTNARYAIKPPTTLWQQ
jgi:hypothetical protein